MKFSLCREFIKFLDRDGSLKSGYAPEPVIQWLEGLDLPMDLLRFLQWDWPQTDCQLAHIRIQSSVAIRGDEATTTFLKYKFFNAGWAPNGDWFLIDFSTDACAPGFVTHDEWIPWGDESGDPREFFQPVARNFESFLYRLVEDRYLPTDFYAAREYNEFLAEEQKAEPTARDVTMNVNPRRRDDGR
jgi:hypothetical protein